MGRMSNSVPGLYTKMRNIAYGFESTKFISDDASLVRNLTEAAPQSLQFTLMILATKRKPCIHLHIPPFDTFQPHTSNSGERVISKSRYGSGRISSKQVLAKKSSRVSHSVSSSPVSLHCWIHWRSRLCNGR